MEQTLLDNVHVEFVKAVVPGQNKLSSPRYVMRISNTALDQDVGDGKDVQGVLRAQGGHRERAGLRPLLPIELPVAVHVRGASLPTPPHLPVAQPQRDLRPADRAADVLLDSAAHGQAEPQPGLPRVVHQVAAAHLRFPLRGHGLRSLRLHAIERTPIGCRP
ncbi:hypothetical protein ON010_g11288 [Phytophthora cinnamomi]|nr:hypothetical protein ON010_g11288 [Phytophthora cinnamomi]